MERIGEWTIALVKGVRNADPLLTAAEQGTIPACVIRGEMIASRIHLAVAVERLRLNPNLARRADAIAPRRPGSPPCRFTLYLQWTLCDVR